jgi:hypothetical protein
LGFSDADFRYTTQGMIYGYARVSTDAQWQANDGLKETPLPDHCADMASANFTGGKWAMAN